MMTAIQEKTRSQVEDSYPILQETKGICDDMDDVDDIKDNTNKVLAAFKQIQAAFAGEAYKAGFENEEAMQSYVKALRKQERR